MNAANGNSKRCQVKVCGVREPAEAAALDALGVEWIGFNFHPGSARHIAPEAAAPLIRSLRRAEPVGVFADADPDFVIDVIAMTGIRHVQLHGGEDWEYVRRMPVPVIKALPHTRLADLGGLRAPLEAALRGGGPVSPLAFFLIDTQAGKAGGFGGSGLTFDWNLLAEHSLHLPFFLAGGLGPRNLAEALGACAPFAVDLNSKVEISPGKKDLEKIRACLEIVRG
ncbi:MAG TPA: phosphoribosylanthranilate isomerase [Fibrobacteria bacterium]|nr:phosphoribosylanthranilate isomerase [Fibrobacteria bacterium]